MTAPALEVTGVTKRFAGVVALADVDLTVQAGELVGIIGPNGSGKTTLFNCIAGAVTPDRGRIALDGREITGVPRRSPTVSESSSPSRWRWCRRRASSCWTSRWRA